jgi:hypothetical protein
MLNPHVDWLDRYTWLYHKLYPNFIYPPKNITKKPENGSKFHDLIQEKLARASNASKALIWSRSQAIEAMEDSCTAA